MKKATLLFFLFIGIRSSYSQIASLPEDSTTWHYIIYDTSGPFPTWYNNDYEIMNDTIINTIQYNILESTWFGAQFLLRQDSSGKVFGRYLYPSNYACTDSSELIIYDFSLGVNDSIYIHNCYGDSSLSIVKEVDSIALNIGYRKRLIFAEVPEFYCYTLDSMIWIESIGSQQDLFYNFNFFSPGSVCLNHYEFGGMFSYGQNIYPLSSVINEPSDVASIYIDYNQVLYSSKEINKMEIYDEIGRRIRNELVESNFVNLSSNELQPSFYLIVLFIDHKKYSLKYFKK